MIIGKKMVISECLWLSLYLCALWIPLLKLYVIAGILQTRENGRLCEAVGSGTNRWKLGLQRPRKRSDDMFGYSGSVLCTASSKGEEQR